MRPALRGSTDAPARDDLAASYGAARDLMRAHGRTFYFAARLLRPDRRRATYALYALFRTLDDLVDDAAEDTARTEAVRAELAGWRRWLEEPSACTRDERMADAVRDTICRYGVPTRYFFDLIDGLEMDLDRHRYRNFAELALYCYRVAATVGLVMCSVLGTNDPAAARYAVELGVAMQLTNIVRDVADDARRGRLYIPDDLARAAGWDGQCSWGSPIDDGFRAVLRLLIERARIYYARGLQGLAYLIPILRDIPIL